VSTKRIVLDANILIRAVLGNRVGSQLEMYQTTTMFCTSFDALEEAREHIPSILEKRGWSGIPEFLETLELLPTRLEIVPQEVFEDFMTDARARLSGRDEDDAHILALALAFDCPIWTEDLDFFGIGVRTWKSDKVQLFLEL
jgi:predicted nucleic acid-binding protein